MIARPYQREDAYGLDRLLGFNRAGYVRLEHDDIFVVGSVGKPRGVLVMRPGCFIHELQCGSDLRARLRADALANYAIGHSKAKGLTSAIFLVKGNNEPMQRWAESIGAVRQDGDVLYVLTP